MRIYGTDANADGSPATVEMPTRVRLLGIFVDPGGADATVTFGGQSFLVRAAGGPGPMPLAAPAWQCAAVTIANADGSASILLFAED